MNLTDLYIVISELNEELFTNDDDYHLYVIAGSYTEGILLNEELIWDDQNHPSFSTREELKTYIREKIEEIANTFIKALKRKED